MASVLAVTLGTVGPVLTCIGAGIQFAEWRKSTSDSKRIATIREYIEQLDESVDDLRRQDKTPGITTKEGLDIGKTFEILQAATEQANKKNRKKLREMTASLGESASRRERYVVISLALIVVGTLFWAVSSFI